MLGQGWWRWKNLSVLHKALASTLLNPFWDELPTNLVSCHQCRPLQKILGLINTNLNSCSPESCGTPSTYCCRKQKGWTKVFFLPLFLLLFNSAASLAFIASILSVWAFLINVTLNISWKWKVIKGSPALLLLWATIENWLLLFMLDIKLNITLYHLLIIKKNPIKLAKHIKEIQCTHTKALPHAS